MGLSSWADDLKKKHDIKQKMISEREAERISSGSVAVDYRTGGGWAVGEINEVSGWPSAGKTTLSLMTAAAVQRWQGKGVVYIAAEPIQDDYAQSLGVNFDGDLWAPYSERKASTVANIIQGAITNSEKTNLGLIVIDSASAIVPDRLLDDEDAYTPEAIGERARFWSQFCPIITAKLTATGVAILFVNQLRQNINTGPWTREEDKEKTTGGNALQFYMGLRVGLKQGQVEYEKDHIDEMFGSKEKLPIGQVVWIKALKNKIGGKEAKTAGDSYIRYGEGFDNLWSAVKIFLHHGKIAKSGQNTYTFMDEKGEEITVRSRDKLDDELAKRPALLNLWLEERGFKHKYFVEE